MFCCRYQLIKWKIRRYFVKTENDEPVKFLILILTSKAYNSTFFYNVLSIVCCQGENLKIVAENMKLSIESPCIWFFKRFPRHHCVTVFVFSYFQQVRYYSLYSFHFVFVFVSNRFGTTWSTARWATGWSSTRWPET